MIGNHWLKESRSLSRPSRKFGRDGHPLVIFHKGAVIVFRQRSQEVLFRNTVLPHQDLLELDAAGNGSAFRGSQPGLRQNAPVEQNKEPFGLLPRILYHMRS